MAVTSIQIRNYDRAASGRFRGGQQQTGGEAPVRPPVLGKVGHLSRVREVIEAVARLGKHRIGRMQPGQPCTDLLRAR
jgi:hypothetical protein